ncbi:GTP pyrophosphokinase [Priestia koreensis]|uniref:GTP pyrophosphokinase n=1 Tax=Priestia koreensis TaxID=284581 RepID=UPI00203F272C|nr:(p)ppGpp synthetase [Priestia koreensis]MCM3003665.1 (p)ppGpp synthetase [Priestia koreensis]
MSRTGVHNPILTQYKAKKELHNEFSAKVELLLKDILKQHDVNYHSIDSRVKEEDSLTRKIDKANGKYNELGDITDISGIRIITYFSDDVDNIAKIINTEFDIDEENSVDKRTKLDADRFGYLSLHYVVELKESRLSLAEYSRYKGFKLEIQIRSILQHAWAEIEHDLGYKSKTAIPTLVRRDFSRLAGLLELADEEFLRIRKTLKDYNEDIKEDMISDPSSISIDTLTITEMLKTDTVMAIDQSIAEHIGASVMKTNYSLIEGDVERVKYLGFVTIGELMKALTMNKDKIIAFAQHFIKQRHKKEYFRQGISLFYLNYILIAEKSEEEIIDYLSIFNIGETSQQSYLANKIIQTFKEISHSK